MTHYVQLVGKKKKCPFVLGEMLCHYIDVAATFTGTYTLQLEEVFKILPPNFL